MEEWPEVRLLCSISESAVIPRDANESKWHCHKGKDMQSLELYEQKIISDSEFPVQMFVNDKIKKGWYFTQHWHEHIELHYVLEGMTILRLGQREISAREGNLVIVNSNELHAGYCDGIHMRVLVIIFDMSDFYKELADKNVIFQGDGLKKMPIIDLANIERGVKKVSCLILSNTCDMDLSNSRMFPASIMYAPIINLTTYISVLQKQGINSNKIENHISDIKQQKITQIIFLPANSQMEDSIVFLDKIYHVDNRFINRDTLEDQRLFSLSDYGFYMLIFKLSIHFSRIQEKVNRGCIAN